MINHIFSSNEMWTEVGISTVEQSDPYYRADGYWNGVATTALNIWEKECKESYYTFEHFIISSQRGTGWHQFSGLSSPILN